MPGTCPLLSSIPTTILEVTITSAMPSPPQNTNNVPNNPRLSPVTTTSNPRSFDSPYARTTGSLRSCTTCRRRKVRCNKETPCSNCTRNGVTCIFPPPGRARPTPRVRRSEAELPGRNLAATAPIVQHLSQALGFQGTESETIAGTTVLVPSTTEAQDMSAPTTIDRQSRVSKEPIPGIEQWIERCLYLGERPPKSFYQLERKLAASFGGHSHTSALARLTELVRHCIPSVVAVSFFSSCSHSRALALLITARSQNRMHHLRTIPKKMMLRMRR
ncbi:hypothetical protein GQ53DRAFT_84825 [Thozetella sp. PMI_491]|nr:hypothetical protein GQ53DRAFT_84825 [Thozetella sp. PMI_491]